MLASITPLGQRGRGASWRRTVTAYVVASIAGGSLVGLALGALGSAAIPHRPTWAVVTTGALALLAAALDLRGKPPGIRRQVDEAWLGRYRDWVVGVGFGFQLGLAAVTIATSAATYVTWLLEVLVADPAYGALVGGVFGLARALPLLTMRVATDPTSLRAVLRRWQSWARPLVWITVGVQAGAGAVLLVVAR